jgi:prefoldin beta subunit
MDKETSGKLQELQVLEQNLQAIMMQKQAFQFELNESVNASEELGKTKDDVFKLLGNILIKAGKSEIEKQLKEKVDILSLRLKSIEKQEKSLAEKAEELRQAIVGKMQH